MDFLNKAKNELGKEFNSMGSAAGQTSMQGEAGAQQEDYVDKGLDTAERQFGVHGNRQTNEKVTDFARNQYEKQTGSKVNSKISN